VHSGSRVRRWRWREVADTARYLWVEEELQVWVELSRRLVVMAGLVRRGCLRTMGNAVLGVELQVVR